MKSIFIVALVAVSNAQTNNLNDYQGMTEEEKDIIQIENIVENLDTEDQVEFLIEHLLQEKEAVARQEQFENITPEDGEIGLSPYANSDEAVVRE